jgi:phosphonate transport system permease protein
LAAPAGRFRASSDKPAFPWLLTAAFVVTFAASLRVAEVDPTRLADPQALVNVGRFVRGALPPRLDAEFLAFLVRPLAETVQISVMGTVIAVLLGAPLGLLATSSLTWRGILHERASAAARLVLGVVPYGLARLVLSVFRSIPEYVWAFMFVRAVGLGPFAGVLAIGVAYGGMLGKVYSEIFEAADPRPIEALHAAGAGRAGIVLYGLLPAAVPHLLSYTLYRWECAIRASAVLGFVGAGGLGQQIELAMRMFQFDEVGTLLAILLALVWGVDVLSGRIRARLVR